MRYLNINNSCKPIQVCNKKLYYLDIVDFTDDEIATDEFKFAIESKYLKPYDLGLIVDKKPEKKRKRKSATTKSNVDTTETEV